MLPPLQLDQAITQLVREEWGRILASLVNSVGSLQLAEDSLQDAVEKALVVWLDNGIPANPSAWLLKTAKHRAIDHHRRRSRFAQLQPDISYMIESASPSDIEINDDTAIPDQRLELIFTCCHPALDLKTRVALTLRALGGLSTEEIARAFLDKKSTMAQRLSRAKQKISSAGISYEVPAGEKLPERVNGVLAVIYFIFNEGYAASTGETLTRSPLIDEAVRLGRVLRSLLPEHCECNGLLALMLLHDSRRLARVDENGRLIMLEHQQRNRWDKAKIKEGITILKDTLVRGQVGPYQLQAAISAIHAESITWEHTDWAQIAALYNLLYSMNPSPVVRVNQAVAISYAHTAQAGLAVLNDLAADDAMKNYQPYLIAKADVLLRAGHRQEAINQLKEAIVTSENNLEREFLEHRLRTHYDT